MTAPAVHDQPKCRLLRGTRNHRGAGSDGVTLLAQLRGTTTRHGPVTMTRLSGFEHMSGDEWQELCLRVLHEHHPGPELIEVPDDDRGDAGLEAFSLGGCAYQCYAPEGEPLTLADRYRKQRDKMTTDVRKLIDNSETIAALIPDHVKLNRWTLLVPFINSKNLVQHAAKKTAEVQSANLPYASPDITVVAQTLGAFEGARNAVINRQLTRLSLPPLPAADFSNIDDALIITMDAKLRLTSQYAADDKRRQLINRLLANYVGGRAHRDHVSDHYSELGDYLEQRLADLEERLSVQYALDEPAPDRRFVTVLKDTEQVVEDVLRTHAQDSRVIAEGQVGDWLMRCPLDFV